VLRHAVHFGLKLACGDWQPALIRDKLRFVKVIFDFLFDLTLRDNRIQRRLRPRIVFRPDPVPPIHLFDRILTCHTLG
jgi:hypothetical protein